jgi:hypothetical protein
MKIEHHPVDFHGLLKGYGRARLVPAPNVVGHSLDHLIGTWDETDAKHLLRTIRARVVRSRA